ncbi:hypothetical protein GCM10009720_17980 [Yaniella flava]|uniref:Uncharacterized protein n=1 Tax=Yaniella flava TaxID=287930 RepID=A0ABP5G0L9_9MICC
MIPRGLLHGKPVRFEDVRIGDVIDTYHPVMEHSSRFHRRMGQIVTSVGPVKTPSGTINYRCDLHTDYDMICLHFDLWIQLRHRDTNIQSLSRRTR